MSPTKISIRRAEMSDAEALLALVDALADYEKLPRPDTPARHRLLEHAFGEKGRIEVFLAEFEKKVVGYAITLETYSSFLALPTLYLEDLFVLQEYRSKKVGYFLFTHCVLEAHRRGCGRMEWAVLDWNRPAIEFYERFGAKQLNEWLTYRLLREDIERIAAGAFSDGQTREALD